MAVFAELDLLRPWIEKATALAQGIFWLCGKVSVPTGVLRSYIGVWVWCALLRREVLCVPHAIFRMLDRQKIRS